MNYIELAQECQLIGMRPHLDGIYQDALIKFANLIAAQEREECAKLCEETWQGSPKAIMGEVMNYIELAQECQLIGMRPHLDGIYQDALIKFANLIEAAARADEREECAKLCDEVGKESLSQWPYRFANMIRARGTT